MNAREEALANALRKLVYPDNGHCSVCHGRWLWNTPMKGKESIPSNTGDHREGCPALLVYGLRAEIAPRSIVCPTCHAEHGYLCRDEEGFMLASFHPARLNPEANISGRPERPAVALEPAERSAADSWSTPDAPAKAPSIAGSPTREEPTP